MVDVKSTLTETLRAHLICECGQWAENMDETVEHLADVLLALPGVAVTALPEPDETTSTVVVEAIRKRWTENGILVREGFPVGVMAHSHVMSLLDEIDRLRSSVRLPPRGSDD